ncbi:MAG: GntR family transcriptional regulator, partial [Solirubrobacterales bacterium]|nr:GntR family transcriptional regulator [Solirubrobacterales bacterium]
TAIYRSWFNAALVPGLENSPGLAGSLSVVLAEDYGLVPNRSENELEVVRSTREEAELLGTSGDTPLLVVSSTNYLPNGRPIEYSQLAWLGDRVRFHVTSYDDEVTARGPARTPDAEALPPAPAPPARSRPGRSTPPVSG